MHIFPRRFSPLRNFSLLQVIKRNHLQLLDLPHVKHCLDFDMNIFSVVFCFQGSSRMSDQTYVCFLGEQQSEEIFRLLTLLSPFAGEVVSIILMIMRRTMMTIQLPRNSLKLSLSSSPLDGSLCSFHKGLWAEGEHRRCFGENL